MNSLSLLEQSKLDIHNKYPWLSESDVNIACKTAIKDYYLRVYPFGNAPSVKSLSNDFIFAQWVYDRMEDILSRTGGTNVTSYRENGISISYGSTYINEALLEQLTPNVSIPK